VKDEDDETPESDAATEKENATSYVVCRIVEKLTELSSFPIIAGSPRSRAEIAELVKNPDPKRLWRLFSKGNFKEGNTEVSGGNLQMPP
jgi:hypothetical protein